MNGYVTKLPKDLILMIFRLSANDSVGTCCRIRRTCKWLHDDREIVNIWNKWKHSIIGFKFETRNEIYQSLMDLYDGQLRLTKPNIYNLTEDIRGSIIVDTDNCYIYLDHYTIMFKDTPAIIINNRANCTLMSGTLQNIGITDCKALTSSKSTNLIIGHITIIKREDIDEASSNSRSKSKNLNKPKPLKHDKFKNREIYKRYNKR